MGVVFVAQMLGAKCWALKYSESKIEEESESNVESDDKFNQHFVHLNMKDKLIMLKVIDKISEQEECLDKQDKFVIKRIEEADQRA
jgi:carbonic anhydrase